jgi:hypothetical protein
MGPPANFPENQKVQVGFVDLAEFGLASTYPVSELEPVIFAPDHHGSARLRPY